MAVKALPRIAESLIAACCPKDEPVAIVERGTLPDQRVTHAIYARPRSGSAFRLRAPAITVIGPVAALGQELSWQELRPLHGRSHRRDPSACPGRARWRRGCAISGAEVVEAPAIRTRSLEAAAELALIRPALRHVAERRRRAVRAAARRTLARRAHGRRHRPGNRSRPDARAASSPTSSRARAVAEGLLEALAPVPLRPALGGPGARGPGHAAGRAARPAALPSCRGAVRDGRRAGR